VSECRRLETATPLLRSGKEFRRMELGWIGRGSHGSVIRQWIVISG